MPALSHRRPPRAWWPTLGLAAALGIGLVLLAADPPPSPAAAAVTAGAAAAADGPPAFRVDLNRASRAELEALPGIGEQRAAAIIAARADAPLRSLADAVERGLLPAAVAESLRGLASAGP